MRNKTSKLKLWPDYAWSAEIYEAGVPKWNDFIAQNEKLNYSLIMYGFGLLNGKNERTISKTIEKIPEYRERVANIKQEMFALKCKNIYDFYETSNSLLRKTEKAYKILVSNEININ